MERKRIPAAIALTLGAAISLPVMAERPLQQEGSPAGAAGQSSEKNYSTGQGNMPGSMSRSTGQMHSDATNSGMKNNTVTRRADELDGMDVVNTQGKEIGEVKAVVRGASRDDLQAVVSVGGFLGIGDKKVAIPLQDMQLIDGKLRTPMASSESDLKARAAYDDKLFTKVSDEHLIQIGSGTAQAMDNAPTSSQMRMRATAQGSTPSASDFEALDVNRDGYVSKEEAADEQGLSSTWDEADRNRDGRLDQSEFSAFEPTHEGDPEMKTAPREHPIMGDEPMRRESDSPTR